MYKTLDITCVPRSDAPEAHPHDVLSVAHDVVREVAKGVRIRFENFDGKNPRVFLDLIPDKKASSILAKLTIAMAEKGWHMAKIQPGVSALVLPVLDGQGYPDETVN